jgi:HK97 family phage portal protein
MVRIPFFGRKQKTVHHSPMTKSAPMGLAEFGNYLRGIGGRDTEFPRSKWGAAQSYYIISYVEKCVELISSGIVSLPYTIKRYNKNTDQNIFNPSDEAWDGIVVASSKDVTPRHPLFQLFQNYQQRNHRSLLLQIAISLTLYDENYLELVRRKDDYPVSRLNPLIGLDWLNPLGINFTDNNGRIDKFWYTPVNNGASTNYAPFEIAYTHGFNPRDDLRGYPDVLAAVDSLTIDNSIQRAVVNHFKNGIGAQAIATQKEGFGTLQSNREGLEDVKKRSRGPEQYGSYTYWPRNLDITKLDYPRYDQITSYSKDNIDRILDQFGVPRAIIGNSDIAGYKQGDETTYRFYVGNIIPRAQQIIEYLNQQIMPLFPVEYQNDRIEVDSSEFDRVSENDMKEADLAGKNLSSGIITINEARKRQGLKEWESDNGDLLMLPAGTILVNPKDLESGFVVGFSAEEAATTLASGSDGPASALIGEMHQMMQGEDGGEAELPPTPAPESLGATARTPEETKQDFEDGVISLAQFMRSRGQTPPPAQAALFETLYKFDDKLVPIEEVGNLWKYDRLVAPSTTNATLIETDLPQEETEAKHVHKSCVSEVVTRSQPAIEQFSKMLLDNGGWDTKEARQELDNCYRRIKSRKTLKAMDEFELRYVRGDIGDWLRESLSSYDKATAKHTVKWYFEEAKRLIAIKSIQATRIEFEDDFEDALQVYIDGKTARQQWGLRARAMIRKANNKAFRDGLDDGGVTGEEPSDDEKAQINQFISEQSKYVTELGAAVKSGALKSAAGKGATWFNKSVRPMYQAGFGSAAANMMVEWVLGRTEEHCKSCSGYNGQRHRYKSWMRVGAIPQSDELACNGFNCECNLVPVQAKARGRLVLIKNLGVIKMEENNPAYAYVALGARDELVAIQNQLKQALSGFDGIHWEDPETFHVTLVYAPNISDEELESSAIGSIDGFKIAQNPLEISKLGIFKTPDGQALHLVVEPNLSLESMQAWIHDEFGDVELSKYSNPDGYNPHITMGYVPNVFAIPAIKFEPFSLGVDTVVYGRDDYEEIKVIETSVERV